MCVTMCVHSPFLAMCKQLLPAARPSLPPSLCLSPLSPSSIPPHLQLWTPGLALGRPTPNSNSTETARSTRTTATSNQPTDPHLQLFTSPRHSATATTAVIRRWSKKQTPPPPPPTRLQTNERTPHSHLLAISSRSICHRPSEGENICNRKEKINPRHPSLKRRET